ncbi:DUF6064 family protein [Marinobacter sp. F4206]|uniref:DUF6064 family protein n=1 Tax=Marinobacter sp. F4206 TaxID=2861777 RepID=UPI001C5EF41D|nr:DUF6064 family protein [Marinobacter sp. F4206]MBW4935836.1 hypothetical protein [Marinobacter sp. F4206]
MFGPEVFLRLFVRINQDIWPWQFLIVPLGLAVPWMVCRPEIAWRRLALVVVAAAWIASGFGFLVSYFGEINWPAAWMGWAFTGQGILLAVLAFTGDMTRFSSVRAGWFTVFWLVSVLLLPWLAVLESGQLRALALFGLTPGVTVAASALLVRLPGRTAFWLLLPVPAFWMLFSAATSWTLQTYWLLLIPLASLVFGGAGFWLSPRPVQSPDRQCARHDPARQ